MSAAGDSEWMSLISSFPYCPNMLVHTRSFGWYRAEDKSQAIQSAPSSTTLSLKSHAVSEILEPPLQRIPISRISIGGTSLCPRLWRITLSMKTFMLLPPSEPHNNHKSFAKPAPRTLKSVIFIECQASKQPNMTYCHPKPFPQKKYRSTAQQTNDFHSTPEPDFAWKRHNVQLFLSRLCSSASSS